MSRPPIYGMVPGTTVLPAPLPEGIRVEEEAPPLPEPKKKKPPPRDQSWRKGYPRHTTKQEILEGRATPLKSSRPPLGAPELGAMGHCIGCDNVLMAVSLPLVRELVRVARDRLAYDANSARSDVLYLAARLDGYCSLGCWKVHGPEALVKEVAP